MVTLKESLIKNIRQTDKDAIEARKSLIEEWLKEMRISWYTIRPDFTINVHEDVWIKDQYLTEFPSYIQFSKVKGEFNLSYTNIKSLRGCPREVIGDFNCMFCPNLKNLEGAPEIVYGSFYCNNCRNLESIKGAPRQVHAFLMDTCPKVKSLEGAPINVESNFVCTECYNLVSLEGAPKTIGGRFSCAHCRNLRDLVGAPLPGLWKRGVRNDFDISWCSNLKSLDGIPNNLGVVYCEEVPEKIMGELNKLETMGKIKLLVSNQKWSPGQSVNYLNSCL